MLAGGSVDEPALLKGIKQSPLAKSPLRPSSFVFSFMKELSNKIVDDDI